MICTFLRRLGVFVFLLTSSSSLTEAAVIINEIMYHPSSQTEEDEWIELHNNAGFPVNLNGWQLSGGIQYSFGSVSIPANGYLVVAANAASFSAKYPATTNIIAPWIGQLSNSSNKITLKNSLGTTQDEVEYADDGDWADRVQDNPPDLGHRGWGWNNNADGSGKSLELIQPAADNSIGQNWGASTANFGTPGVVNSIKSNNVAPFILNASHFPIIPRASDSVLITAKITDDANAISTVKLYFREDGITSFTNVNMVDTGNSGDVIAGDFIYSASIPAKTHGKIVEFYIQATDSASLVRNWPKAALDYLGASTQACNALYQVDDTVYTAATPLYKIIMKAADRTTLNTINSPTTPDDNFSHARFNCTFITLDGSSTELRYRCGTRNRGHGSATRQPPNFNLSIPHATSWKGKVAFDFNSAWTYLQLLGSALYRQAGVATPESRQIQLRVNGSDPTLSGGSAADFYNYSYGFYVCNEEKNSDFAAHHFPSDSAGNIYAVRREDNAPNREGDLGYLAPSVGQQPADPYRICYFKQTNTAEDDWSDLVALINAIRKGHNGALVSDPVTWDADYLSAIQATVDVAQWMRWMAVQALFSNGESNLSRGTGDDYFIYFGKTDRRAKLIPHDLDTILGDGDYAAPSNEPIFMQTRRQYQGTVPTPLNTFMKRPEFTPVYYKQLLDLMNGPLSPTNLSIMCDQILTGLVPQSVIDARKSWYNARVAFVRTLIPLIIQNVSAPSLTITNGYPRAVSASCQLTGQAPAVDTRSVKVNGVTATWSAWDATWNISSVALTPGINRILIQAFDMNAVEIDRTTFDVWYDKGSTSPAPANISANSTWSAATGPYSVTSNVVINAGATLTIQPGTSVYFASGTKLTVAVGGKLIANGTPTQPIRFSAAPAAPATWAGIEIQGTLPLPQATEISHAFIEHHGTGGAPAILAGLNSNIVLHHLEFGTTTNPYLHLDGGSFLIYESIFPTPTAAFEPIHGFGPLASTARAIIRDCFFGKPIGYNDTIDFSSVNRTGPIFQFINNVCVGSDDDILDLDSADGWIEGNVFMRVHRNGSPDSASAISGGGNDDGHTSDITVVGNIFYDVDYAATAKDNNFYTFLNNTVYHQNRVGSQDASAAVLNLGEENPVVIKGKGMYLEGNIFHNIEAIANHYNPVLSTVTLNNNITSLPWGGPGSGNTVVDPYFNDVSNIPVPTERNYRYLLPRIRQMFALQSRSPAKGTGPNGTDKGAIRNVGVSLSGAPTGTVNQTTATLNVGSLMTGNGIPNLTGTFPNGSGWTHYKSRLDGGAWSAEMPIATQITLSGLSNGPHFVEVVGKNDAGYYQDDGDFGISATITKSATWTVDTSYTPPTPQPIVQINEVLAQNTEGVNYSGVYPDMIELRNAGTVAADLSGWGLTDNSSLPFKYTIPNGTTLAPGALLVFHATNSALVPLPRTGFGIKAVGDTITLTRSAAAGGGIADSISYGNQIANYAIGRATDGTWTLCAPTLGAANQILGIGSNSVVRINEWLADPGILASDDFVELFNPSNYPVDIGSGFLTDNSAAEPTKHPIRQLTFIGPGGYLLFHADGNTGSGEDHLSFKLSALQGEIVLFNSSQTLIDVTVYGPQRTDISQGRTPNGSNNFAFFAQPTPGAPNPSAPGSQLITLIPSNQVWKFYSNTSAPPNDSLGSVYFAPNYNDSNWLSGTGTFYIEPDPFPANSDGFSKNTALPQRAGGGPFATNYFRTHFNFPGPLSGTTLTAKLMADDGCVIYLNGVEILPTTNARIRMSSGAVNYNTVATSAPDVTVETYNLPTSQLVVGDNVLVVEVHQSGTTSSDITWGMKLDATLSTPIILNEVLVINTSIQNPDTSYSAWIELYNSSESNVNLADYSLSNSVSNPRAYVFGNVTVPTGSFHVVQCNPMLGASSTNTGFGLNENGDQVYVFSPLASGGALLSSISFGQQVTDRAVGRNSSGNWVLTTPTRGATNSAAATNSISGIKINEWSSAPTAEADWFELYNTSASPALLSGSYLTDDLTVKNKFLIPQLSFIGPTSSSRRWQKWVADGDSGKRGHVNFSLSSSGGSIGLFTSGATKIDSINYGAQSPNQSGGRFSDGSATMVANMPPTPGTANSQFPADSDNDGMSNAWETANGLNPNDATDAALDSDGDGQTNLQEYLGGTNPFLPGSRLSASVTTPIAGQFSINFTALAGKTYTVRYKNSPTDTIWSVLQQLGAPSVDTPTSVYDVPPAGTTARFYQVITPAQP